MKADRYHASLLKANDLPTTPLYVPQRRLLSSSSTMPMRTSSPQESLTDSNVSLARVTMIPRCRESIASNPIVTSSQTARTILSTDYPLAVTTSTFGFSSADENRLSSFFEMNGNDHGPLAVHADVDTRKTLVRLPLEVVPEMNELDVAHSRQTVESLHSSTLPLSHRSHSMQTSPTLITFDSSSLKRCS
jgi:hypothetical protein